MLYKFETEDEAEFNLRMNGPKYFNALHELYRELRLQWKHDHPEDATWFEAYTLFDTILTDHGIDLWEVV